MHHGTETGYWLVWYREKVLRERDKRREERDKRGLRKEINISR